MKLQEMIGVSVFDVEDGKEIGKVVDFILSEDWKILGIVLESKGLFTSYVKAVLWEEIIAYGEDAVMIRNQQAVCKLEAENIQTTFSLGDGKVKDMSVLTRDGNMIGHVSDVYFDQNMGNTITGLEISDGFISDLVEGRKMLPYTEEMLKGENSIIVPSLCEQQLEKTINSVDG